MMARICAISHSWTRRAALARLLRETEAGILLNEHIAEDGPTVFAHACRLGAEGIVSKRVDGFATPPASPRSGSGSGTPTVGHPLLARLLRQLALPDVAYRRDGDRGVEEGCRSLGGRRVRPEDVYHEQYAAFHLAKGGPRG
jgi:hypothetical protein